MKLTLYLRPHCAKYLAASCELQKPIDLTKPFGRMLLTSLTEKPQGRPKKFETHLKEVEVLLPMSKNHAFFRPDRKVYVISKDDMAKIDEYIDQLFRFEIMKSIEQRGSIQKKHVFLSILERFDLTSDEFSFDAMAKFEQRYKNKFPSALIFG